MKLQSFRLRIALLSTALAGGALLGFCIVALQLIYVAKVSRLDAKLETLTKRAVRPRSPDWWQPFIASLPQEFDATPDTPIVVLVLGRNGEPIYQSQADARSISLHRLLLPLLPASAIAPSPLRLDPLPDPHLFTQKTPMGSWRIGVLSSSHAQGAIAVSLRAVNQEMAVIYHIFGVAIPGMLLLVAGGAWFLSGNALRPIQQLTHAMQQLTVTGLNQPVPIESSHLEFVELIQVFNQMLERLERSFKQASRFSGDAAHELKTPLAILQGELEQILQQAELGSALQQDLSNLLDEVHRLSSIVRKLLLLSLADAGQMSLHRVEVNLSELLSITIEDLELMAPHLTVKTEIADGLVVWGDRDLLTQILQNLISNAIKYNLPDGWIHLHAHHSGSTVQITIANSSQTIPVGDRDRIFDRFYRGDPARTRRVEGIGLGLSLSREIARAHQGDLWLDHSPLGHTAFTLSIPQSFIPHPPNT